MPRRLNFTGRQKILRAHAGVKILENGPVPSFAATLDLAPYDLPDGARVIIEAYRQTTRMQFDHGLAGSIRHPDDCRLTDFGSAEGVLFRIRVTDEGERHGVLLAAADRIRPSATGDPDEPRDSLLAVLAGRLDGALWTLEYEPQPLLIVDERHGDVNVVARTPVFTSLVYPQVLRSVLERIHYADGDFDEEDDTSWQVQWLHFANSLPGVGPRPVMSDDDVGPETIDEWIDDVVKSFGRTRKVHELFARYWSEGQDR